LRNYYYLPPLFDQIKVPFNEDIMRSIQRGELGHAKQLLFKIRDALGEQTPCPRIDDRVQMTMSTLNIDQRCKAKGMCEKNLGIEKKLVAFEDEFLRQKDVAHRKKQNDD
jgi:hypothetical protein